MAQLVISAVSFGLFWLIVLWAGRREKAIPALPEAEPLPRQRRQEKIRIFAANIPPSRRGMLPRRVPAIRLLSKLLPAADSLPSLTFLQDNSREFLLALMTTRAQLRHLPRLPADPAGVPRLLSLCVRHMALGGTSEAVDLLTTLAAAQEGTELSLPERLYFPLGLRLCLAAQLGDVLRQIHFDLRESRRGRRLARRLARSRHPMALTARQQLSVTAVQAMLAQLTVQQQTSLLATLEERMAQDHFSAEKAADQHTRRQARLTDQLARLLAEFRALDQLDWPRVLEQDDPLHKLLTTDPAGVYSRMDESSRSLYLQTAHKLARLWHVEEKRLIRAALELASSAESDGLMDHVGWYLMESQGTLALQRYLHCRKGRLMLLVHRHQSTLLRLTEALSALVSGLIFLHSHQPLWMLPAYLGVSSCLTHFCVRGFAARLMPPRPIPRMAVDRITDDSATLIVLPAVLKDPQQAVAMTRRLLLARKAFPEGAVDCLLLGDYDESITRTSSSDQAVISAARMAVDAANGAGGRFMYFQRSRSWDPLRRVYAGRERRHGAIDTVNRLIVQGHCSDEFDAVTLPAGSLHRRYAFVLALEEDTLPAPDVLLPMIGALIHPLNERRHTPQGIRGFSLIRPAAITDPDRSRSRISQWESVSLSGREISRGDGDSIVGLYRPDSFLEATESWILPGCPTGCPLVEGELAGTVSDPAVTFIQGVPYPARGWLKLAHRRTLDAWLLLPWLLPYVKTPAGVRRNPLSSSGKYRLRQRLRVSVIPLCRLVLLLYAVVSRSTLLTLFALLIPGVPFGSPGSFAARLVELPLRALIRAEAILGALIRLFFPASPLPDRLPFARSAAGDLSAMENWSQGLGALLFALAGLAIQPISLWGVIIAAVFALFPLLRPWMDASALPFFRPTADMETSLLAMAEATWRFFEETVRDVTHHLPPETHQVKPMRGSAGYATPAGTGLYLLSCLAMREMGLLTTDALCDRVSRTMDTLEQLTLWHGLPFHRYDLYTLAPTEPAHVSSVSSGILCACLLTLAQGLRAHLQDTPPDFLSLAERVDAFAGRMELGRLYQAERKLFAEGCDPLSGRPDPDCHELYASQGLLLSFVALMRREVPPEHFAALRRILVRTCKGKPLLSRSGDAGAYLLPALLLPVSHGSLMDHTLRAVARLQQKHGIEGMFGLSESGWWGFDPGMNYRQGLHGVTELALGPSKATPVIAPYAAALLLPFAPREACDSLIRLRSRGMLGQLGFFDSLDLDPAHLPQGKTEAMVQLYTAPHQGMFLCALCNLLTDGMLVRRMMSLPAASAFAALLKERPGPYPILPARVIRPRTPISREPAFQRRSDSLCLPLDAHIIGSPESLMLMNARGGGFMRSRGIDLTRFTGDPTQPEGIRFFLHDGLSTYLLTDPALPGDTLFSEGSICFSRTCGAVQTTLTALTDPVHGSFLHVAEIASHASRELVVDLADCLVPGFQQGGTLEAARPGERVLTLTSASPRITLCHAVSTHEPLLGLSVQTDPAAFHGPNGPWNPPASLAQPLRDTLPDADASPCAGFRLRLRVPPRGRTAVIFITRLVQPGIPFSLEALTPRLSDTATLLTQSGLLSRTITDSLGISQSRAAELTRLFGPLMWYGQPHQGAIVPLTRGYDCLEELGLPRELPLLMLVVHTEGCYSLVRDAADAAAWLRLMGQETGLFILCEGSEAEQAAGKAADVLRGRPGVITLASALPDGCRAMIEAHARVILYEGAGTVTAQLSAMALRLTTDSAAIVPSDVSSEDEPLLFASQSGGFQPGSDDYIVLPPHHQSAAPVWQNILGDKRFCTLSTQRGLLCSTSAPADCRLTYYDDDPLCPLPAETVWLADENSGVLHSVTGGRVQFAPGVTLWRSASDGLEITLTASATPEGCFGLRSLRIKNLTHRSRPLVLTIATRFLMGRDRGDEALLCLTPIEGGASAQSPLTVYAGCVSLVEGSCDVRIVHPLAFSGIGSSPDFSVPDDESGSMALMTLELSLPDGGSEMISWVLGACRQMDDLEQLLARLRHSGISPVFRQVRQQWAARLGVLTLFSPDERLNLMINRLLPWRFHAGQPQGTQPLTVPGLALTHPRDARKQLLAHPSTPFLPLMAEWYIRRTGDVSILQEEDLYNRCLSILRDKTTLTEGEDLWQAMVRVCALDAFAAHCLQEIQQELAQLRASLADALQRHSWADSLLCQCWSVLALGPSERTARAVDQVWQQLFGKFSRHADTCVWLLWALCELGWADRAWALVQAMDPLPQALPSGPDAAAWLYAALTERLLGLERNGNRIRLRPMVPPHWDSFTLTLTVGGAAWHIHARQDAARLMCDGESEPSGWITLLDDGKVHEVHTPLRPQ